MGLRSTHLADNHGRPTLSGVDAALRGRQQRRQAQHDVLSVNLQLVVPGAVGRVGQGKGLTENDINGGASQPQQTADRFLLAVDSHRNQCDSGTGSQVGSTGVSFLKGTGLAACAFRSQAQHATGFQNPQRLAQRSAVKGLGLSSGSPHGVGGIPG